MAGRSPRRKSGMTAPANADWGRFRVRIGAALAALAVQVLVFVALVKGLAAAGVIADPLSGTVAFNLPLAPSSPQPKPAVSGEDAAGRQGAEAPRASPREAAAPAPSIAFPRPAAPPIAASGDANRAGAGESGAGSGAGGTGSGSGSGGFGTGTGAGAHKVEKIAGDIRAARDYPAAGRSDRLGRRVVIAVAVGVDGRPTQCRVARPSGNAEADRITCQLAMERFRFRPATDGNGTPIEAVYGWEQRWFTP